jgi:hydrogenase maturation protein HypF
MAFAALHALGRLDAATQLGLGRAEIQTWAQMILRGVNAPRTSSCGRLFDAAAGLLGVREESRYEGEAAMALEALVDTPRVLDKGFVLDGADLDLRQLLGQLPGRDVREGAALFHGTLAAGLEAWVVEAAARYDTRVVALGGGCLQNRVLTEDLVARLSSADLEVLLPSRAPAGDGGLSLGQAWVAQRIAVDGREGR